MKVAHHNGSRQATADPPLRWAADHSPLFHLSPDDPVTVRHATEGFFATGQTGSGKTTGPGQALALAMLHSGFGFLITTTKPDEAAQWVRWSRLAGRERDIRLFSPQQPYRLSLLDYAYRQGESRRRRN